MASLLAFHASRTLAALSGASLPSSVKAQQWEGDWTTGENKGSYAEGDTIPFRVNVSGLTSGTQYVLQVCRDFEDSGKYGYLTLKAFDSTVSAGTMGVSTSSSSGPFSASDGITLGTSQDLAAQGGCSSGQVETDLQFTTDGGSSEYIYWGGYLAAPLDSIPAPGSGTIPYQHSAGFWPGASLHMHLLSPNKDLPINPSSIIKKSAITVTKVVDSPGTASPDNWCFTISPDPGSQSPLCPPSGGDTVTFVDLDTGSYTITEQEKAGGPAGYHFVSGSGTNCTFSGSTATASVTASTDPQTASCTFHNTFSKLTPTVSTDIHDASGIVTSATIGTTVHDVATVTGASGAPAPSGQVTFTLYDGTGCSTTGSAGSAIPLSSGSASSADTTVGVNGLSYKAHYGGDTYYNAADGPCENLSATKLTPTVATQIHDSQGEVTSAPIGTTVHDEATVTGVSGQPAPTGSVTFTLYAGNTSCTGTGSTGSAVPLSGGSASSGDTTVPAGGLSYVAHYSGDSYYASGDGPCEHLSATKLTPTVSTDIYAGTQIVTSAPIGSTVHDVATVSGSQGTPTGQVTFTLYDGTGCSGSGTTGSAVDLSGGQASSGTTTVPVGGLSYMAHYQGDDTYTSADGPCEDLSASKLMPTVTTEIANSSGDVVTSAPIGSTVHDTVTVTGSQGTPSGQVTFTLYDGTGCSSSGTTGSGVDLGSAGTAASASTTVPVGGLSYMAHYQGDDTYASGDGPCENLSATKLTPTVSTDIYAGTQIVTSAPIGSAVHDVATVSGSQGTPTGQVTFTLYSGSGCSTEVSTGSAVDLSGGSASSASTTVPVGGLSYVAHYAGSDTYKTADGPCEELTGTKLTPTVSTDIHDASGVVTSAPIGSTVHDVATVSGGYTTPTGQVTFTLYGGAGCSTEVSTGSAVDLSGGTASSASTTVPVGGLSYVAHYAGSDTYTSADGPCENLLATKLTPDVSTDIYKGTEIVTSAPIGSTVHDTVTVAGSQGTPTGQVTFTLYDGTGCSSEGSTGAAVGLDGSGQASSGTTTVPVAGLSYMAHYQGDDTYASADGPCEDLSATKLTPEVSTDIYAGSTIVTSAPIGTTVHDEATVSGSQGTPSGQVTFTLYDGSGCSSEGTTGSAVDLSGGQASSGTTTVPVAGLSYMAHYQGDDTYTSADGPCENLAAEKLTPTLSTELSAGEIIAGSSVYDTAALSGATPEAGGTVTYSVYSDADCSLGQRDAGTVDVQNGQVPPSNGLAFDTAGTYYWQAVYSGDGGNEGATSPCTSEVLAVDHPAIAIVKDPSSQSIDSGGSASFTITVTNTGTVTLTNVRVDDALSPSCAKVIGTLDPGKSTSYTCSTLGVTSPFTNSATATGDPPVGPPVSDTDTAGVTVSQTPPPPPPPAPAPKIDLAITKSGAPNPSLLNDTVTWTMVVTNNGPNGATGVTLADPVPAGALFISAATSQGSCSGVGNMLNCNLGDIPVGTSVTVTLVTLNEATGTLTNTATVVGNEQETNAANNKATASVVVTGPFTPPVTYCTAVNVRPKQLFVGRSTLIKLRIVQHGKQVSGVRVQIKGKQIGVVVGKTKTGNLIVRTPNHKKGVTFTYLKKKHRWIIRYTKGHKGIIFTKPSAKKGVVTLRVYAKQAGIVTFAPLASKRCNAPRVGVTGVFTPPVTG